MFLRSSSASPFARKIRIASAVLDLEQEIGILPADTMDPDDSLRSQNPLGKISTLTLSEGGTLYDSAVFLEYVDFLKGKENIIPIDANRFVILTRAALAEEFGCGVVDGLRAAVAGKFYAQRALAIPSGR